MTPDRLREIEQFVARFGPGNCWTGTVGQACIYLRELLEEIEQANTNGIERDAATLVSN